MKIVDYLELNFRLRPAIPVKPTPKSNMVAGSGTGEFTWHGDGAFLR